MTFILWMAVLGAVLLTLALTSSYLRWMPVTAAFCATDGAVPPNGDTVRVSAMNVTTGQITLTSSAGFAGQRWVRVNYS